jgi:hypothetical protein
VKLFGSVVAFVTVVLTLVGCGSSVQRPVRRAEYGRYSTAQVGEAFHQVGLNHAAIRHYHGLVVMTFATRPHLLSAWIATSGRRLSVNPAHGINESEKRNVALRPLGCEPRTFGAC